MSSRFIYVVDRISSLFGLLLNSNPLCDGPQLVYYSPVEGYFCCFPFLAIMGKAAINIVNRFLWRSFYFSWINTRSFIVGYMLSVFLTLQELYNFLKRSGWLSHLAFSPATLGSSSRSAPSAALDVLVSWI